jgi:uncharacterized protein YcfL
MRKFVTLFFMLILLAGCGAPDAVETVDEPLVENSDVPLESEPESTSEVEAVSADAITPAVTAAEAGILRDRDWTKGAEDPLITIIEYGDFQ